MVSTRRSQYGYVTARETELDALLRGECFDRVLDPELFPLRLLRVGETGVLVERGKNGDEPLRPLAIVAHDQDVQRLCGRYAQLRGDLSPLTAWCHLLTPDVLPDLDGVAHEPRFGGTEAAWSGLIVAETLLLAERPLASLRVSACLASASYAVARTNGLWKERLLDTIVERFDFANKLCRGRNGVQRAHTRTDQVRTSFVPMWKCLSALSDEPIRLRREAMGPLVGALAALRDARLCHDPAEAGLLIGPLLETVPEGRAFERLADMAPEARLRLFDELVRTFKETDPSALLRRNALALVTGYLATVAAGGATSLALLDDGADRWPELTGWAYLVGGIGERVTWTSGFDGLGRLVARELQRRLRLDEAPTCDFALDEARVLWDGELRAPLVHLKIKQARVLTVALFPGVNVAIPIVESAPQANGHQRGATQRPAVSEEQLKGVGSDELLQVLATALWPSLRRFVVEEMAHGLVAEGRGGRGSQRSRGKRKTEASSELPLKGSRK